MKYVITDHRLPERCRKTLEAYGYEAIKLPACPALSEPVSAHPDMLVFLGSRLFCHREYYRAAKSIIDDISRITGLEVLLSDEKYGERYPDDVLFNAVELESHILCLEGHSSQHIKKYAADKGLGVVNVRQGYTKCSTCTVDRRSVITADKGIAKTARGLGYDVLEISEGHIDLDGCSYGFIGGASGSDGENVFFSGNLTLHPDGQKIIDFCKAHGKNAVSLSDSRLYDVGSLIFIK